MAEHPFVAVIILNWNGKRWLEPCLDSVLKAEYDNFHIYAVDNGSTDGSQTLIRDKYPMVTLIQNHKNLGFAEGNNVGIRRALKDGADYIMLLNQDTKVDPGCLRLLVESVEADHTIGILSPMHWDYKGNELDKNFRSLLQSQTCFEENLQEGKLKTIYETERVIGAAMMMSRSMCERVGLFDPLYFNYHEETDLCRRTRYHGFRIVVVTGCRIFHYHALVQNLKNKGLPCLVVRNRLLYFLKDPNKSCWLKVKDYLWWGKAKKLMKNTGWPEDFLHQLLTVYTHLWMLFHLPGAFWRTHKERSGPMYL